MAKYDTRGLSDEIKYGTACIFRWRNVPENTIQLAKAAGFTKTAITNKLLVSLTINCELILFRSANKALFLGKVTPEGTRHAWRLEQIIDLQFDDLPDNASLESLLAGIRPDFEITAIDYKHKRFILSGTQLTKLPGYLSPERDDIECHACYIKRSTNEA